MKPRARSFVILTSTLLVGILLGALLHAGFFDKRVKRMHRMSTEDGFVESYLETIQPASPEQEAAVREILRSASGEISEQFRSSREKVRARIDAMYLELAPSLSEEQQQRLAERRERRRRD